MSSSPRQRVVEDYEVLRHEVGGLVVPRDVLEVRGPDAASYLQGQCTQDVSDLEIGAHAESLLLSPQGKIDGYVRVTRTATDVFVLDTEGGWGPAVRARLERFKLRVKAEITDLEWSCVSLRGPESPTRDDAPPGAALVLDFEWGETRGVDLLGPALSVPATVHDCVPAAWDARRVELGIPAMGTELDERTIPVEAGLLERCVSLTKGCYTGQELVARLDARGNRVARHLRGVVMGGDGPSSQRPLDESSVPAGSEMVDTSGAKVVGSITSGAWSPALGPVALGYVHRTVVPPADVTVRVSGEPARTAVVRELPLLP